MREIKTKADTDSPELTGIPTAPTPSDDTNTNQIANIEYITSKLGNTDVFPDDSTIKKDSYLATNGLTKFWTRDLELDSVTTDNTNLNISSNNLNLYGWGKNSNNILNSVETTIHLTPFKISNTCWKSVYCISYSTITNLYAIDKDDYLYTWGNDYKLLGIGSSISQYTPYKISQITKWKQMFVNRNTFAIFAIDKNDLLYSWGCNSSGQTGNGSNTTQLTPYKISSVTKWKHIIPGDYSIYGITHDDLLYVWGSNYAGELGAGSNTATINTPMLVPGNTKWKYIEKKLTQVAYAIDINGYLYGTGFNSYGHLGDGSVVSKKSFVRISETTKWKSVVSAISTTSCTFAIDENDLLYAWGNNDARLIPNGNTSGYQTTPYLISETTKWKVVYTTAYNAFAIDENGYLYGWGNNEVGQLGLGNTTNQYTPIKINTSKWKTIYPMIRYSASDSFIFAIDENDHLYSWGKNDTGSLGTGKADTYQYTPYIFSTTTKWKWVSCDNKTSFGMSVNNELYGWGDNGSSGLVGNGLRSIVQYTPIKISNSQWESTFKTNFSNTFGLVKPVFTLTINDNELALKKDVSPYIHPDSGVVEGTYNKVTVDAQGHVTKGENESPFPNQTDQKNKPLVTNGSSVSWSNNISIDHIKPLTNKIIIGTEEGFAYQVYNNKQSSSDVIGKKLKSAITFNGGTLGITEDNCLFENIFGAPSQLNPDIKWKSLHGSAVPLIIDTNDLLYQYNVYSDPSLNLISSTTKWKYATSTNNGNSSTLFAITKDGDLYSWGYNDYGMSGTGSSNNEEQVTPIKIGNTKWSQISASEMTVVAIDINGYLYTWGSSFASETQLTPHQVSNITKWKYASCHRYADVVAIDINGRLYSWNNNNTEPVLQSSVTTWKYAISSDQNIYGITEDGYLYGQGDYIGIDTPEYGMNLISTTTKWKTVYQTSQFTTHAITEDGYLYSWSNKTNELTPYLVSFTRWKYSNFYDFNEVTLISDADNLTLSNNLTYLNKKVLVEGDINLPITVDENGDYVLG